MKKKVLMLASVASMIDQFNMSNIDILKEMGYEVHVACNFKLGNTSSMERVEIFKKELKELNIKYFQIDFSRNIHNIKSIINAYKQVVSLLKKEKYNFIHCHSPIGGVIGRLASHKVEIKVIYTAHGFHFFKGAPIKNWLIYYPIEKWLARYTNVLITINREDYKIAKNQFNAKNIKLLNGVGVNLKKFTHQTEELKLSARKAHGYNEKDFILIYVAELNFNKHQDLLIDTVNILKEKIPNMRLLLVGLGIFEKRYKKQVENLNLTNYVEFLGYRTDINDLIILSDIAISASRREGLPMNILEAMAVGLPLVVTDCRGNRDLVIDGKNGVIVKTDSVEEFSEKIKFLYTNVELRNEMKQINKVMISYYSIEKINNKMKKCYNECLF